MWKFLLWIIHKMIFLQPLSSVFCRNILKALQAVTTKDAGIEVYFFIHTPHFYEIYNFHVFSGQSE